MSIKGYSFLLFIFVIAIYVIVIYNNLVEVCKQYMLYEQQTLVDVTQARAAVSDARQNVSMEELGPAEQQLRDGLGHLFALAEKYPDLKANETFQNLQTRISALESAIADRREFYNESVTSLNVRVDQFPDRFIATLFEFKSGKLLHFSEGNLKTPDMKALLS